MISAILCQLSMKTNACCNKFNVEQLRLQVIAHLCLGMDYLKPYLIQNVRQLYGSGEELAGPFSVKQWLHFMSKDKEWHDSIFQLVLQAVGV